MQYYGIEDILRTFDCWLYGSPHADVVASQAMCWCWFAKSCVCEPVASRLFGIRHAAFAPSCCSPHHIRMD